MMSSRTINSIEGDIQTRWNIIFLDPHVPIYVYEGNTVQPEEMSIKMSVPKG